MVEFCLKDHMNGRGLESEKTQIVRILRDRNKNYVTIHNAIAFDRRASLKARGLFFTLMTLPPSWDFSVRGLISILKESRNAVYSALDELIDLGYAVKRPLPRKKGQFNRIVLILRENVEDDWPEILDDSTVSRKPHTVNPDTGLGTQLSKHEYTLHEEKEERDRDRDVPSSTVAAPKNHLRKEEDQGASLPEEIGRAKQTTIPIIPTRLQVPDEFPVTAEMLDWASERGVATDIELRTTQFLRHQKRKNYTSDDWQAEWKVWMQHPYDRPAKSRKAKATGEVKDIFGFYQRCHNKNAKLDQKRIETIAEALKLYSVIEIKKAIFGSLGDQWVTGGSVVSSRKHNDISIILKNSDKIDGFIEICEANSYDGGYEVLETTSDYDSRTWTWDLGEKLKNDRKVQFL